MLEDLIELTLFRFQHTECVE